MNGDQRFPYDDGPQHPEASGDADARIDEAVARSRSIDPEEGISSTGSLDEIRGAYAVGPRAGQAQVDRGEEADAFAGPAPVPAAQDVPTPDLVPAPDADGEPATAERDDLGEPTVAMDPRDLDARLAARDGDAHGAHDEELDGIDDREDGFARPVGAASAVADDEPTLAAELRESAVEGRRRGLGDGSAAVGDEEPAREDDDSAPSAARAAFAAPAVGAVGAAAAATAAGEQETMSAAEHPVEPADARRRRTVEIDRTVDVDRAGADGREFAPLGLEDRDEELERPVRRGNRGVGVITALLATLLFGAAFAAAFALLRRVFTENDDLARSVADLVPAAQFWLPVAAFGLVGMLWALIVNRAGWWSYILGGLLVALATAAAYPLGIALQHGINAGAWTFDGALEALRDPANLAPTMLAFILAREIFTWVGGFAAWRGTRLTRRHRRERDEYERALAAREDRARERRAAERAARAEDADAASVAAER